MHTSWAGTAPAKSWAFALMISVGQERSSRQPIGFSAAKARRAFAGGQGSCSEVEDRIDCIGRQLSMSDPVENDLAGRRLRFLNGVRFRIRIQQDIQFRDFRNPLAARLPVQLNGELHSRSLAPSEFGEGSPRRGRSPKGASSNECGVATTGESISRELLPGGML
jgi:hypothetical protein